ncbi:MULTISPECIES: P27 family phage terminase small subunit [Corynebacterium]|uniref:P27 family phage terminase small subunit n=1 Tax=Corynebacterium TaxID=1716 RepID=UPI00124EB1AE|nr:MULTISPECIES: P27 family phage terminase small subunit [Corynebacterium]
MTIDDEFERIRAGRDLNAFDESVVSAVAALVIRLREAQETLAREGAIVDDGKGSPVEHPALQIEKRASAELRGWVKDRPDLFGEQKQSRPRRSKPDFKIV